MEIHIKSRLQCIHSWPRIWLSQCSAALLRNSVSKFVRSSAQPWWRNPISRKVFPLQARQLHYWGLYCSIVVRNKIVRDCMFATNEYLLKKKIRYRISAEYFLTLMLYSIHAKWILVKFIIILIYMLSKDIFRAHHWLMTLLNVTLTSMDKILIGLTILSRNTLFD